MIALLFTGLLAACGREPSIHCDGSASPACDADSRPDIPPSPDAPGSDARIDDAIEDASPYCELDANRECYSGPAGTLGVGRCTAGVQSCEASALWGACLGEVKPAMREACGNTVDDDCDGDVDEGCALAVALPITHPLASHSCAILPDATVACAGRNDYAQLGLGESSALEAVPQPVPSLANVVQLSLGKQGTCATLADHTVRCWGRNDREELIAGAPAVIVRPMAMPDVVDAREVSLGLYHVCVVAMDDSVRCRGINRFGQIGDGTTTDRALPTLVVGAPNTLHVSAGLDHTCALGRDGVVRCWGHNDQGQLGTMCAGSTCNSPTVLAGLGPAVSIATSAQFTCALGVDGAVACWGANSAGQLGHAGAFDATPRTPDGLVGIAVRDIALGINGACALTVAGAVLCWGSNVGGALGDGSTDASSSTARPVSLAVTARALTVGSFQRYVLADDGAVYGWGGNSDGELGDGTRIDRHTPVALPAW